MVTFDAGRPFYNAAAGFTLGFTPYQERLSRFLEGNVTRKGDPARRAGASCQPMLCFMWLPA